MVDRTEPIALREASLGDAAARTFELARRVVADELRLLQMESQERIESTARRSAWVVFGALCLLIAWIALLAAAVVALEGRLSLELRLFLMAVSQIALGAGLIAYGLRDRNES